MPGGHTVASTTCRRTKWVDRLTDQYPRGLFVAATGAVFRRAKALSVGRWLAERLSGKRSQQNEKLPAALGDLYQLVCLGVVAAVTLAWPLNGARSGAATHIAACVLLYRTFEISAVLGAWIFADTARLHSYRRSVIGFTLNAIEISLIASGLGAWLRCGSMDLRPWQQFVAVLTIDAAAGSAGSWACRAIPATRFLMSAALILLVFATLAGGLIRKEVRATRSHKRFQPTAPDVSPGDRS